jgi:hypothetical protein
MKPIKKVEEEKEIEHSEVKSQELADVINIIKPMLHMVDIDYAKSVVKTMLDQASFQDSAAVLSPRYLPERPQLIRQQANALKSFVTFIESLKACDEIRTKISVAEMNQNKIDKMMGI